MQDSKMIVWGGLPDSWEKKRSERQRRKGKIPTECKERLESLLKWTCKEKEENNRMGKTRESSRKLEIWRKQFHEKMGTIKDRNGKD